MFYLSFRTQIYLCPCYVTTGVSVNMMSHGLVAGFSAILFPQLRLPSSTIKVDETSESWIASVFCITSIVGNFISLVIMDKLGRKKVNLISIFIMAAGWYMTVWSSTVTSLIVSRITQGLALGLSIHLGPTMIGEYTSPRYRGAFLATITLAVSCGILITHTLGSFFRWETTALICAVVMSTDFLVVCFSPETPSWLIKKGRYEECKSTFRWLRGLNEEEELTRLIKDNVVEQSKEKKYDTLLQRFLSIYNYFKTSIIKKEFYKPSLIVIHLYILGQWGGSTILSQFTQDIFTYVVGDKINPATMTVALAIHRFTSGIYMMILIDKFDRRTMANSLGFVAVISLLTIAGYAYVRPRNVLPFDHPAIGIVLIHIHMVSVCSGCLAFGFIIAGELFPLKYKSIAGGLSAVFLVLNVFIMAKTGLYLFANIGIEMAYCIYAGVTLYCVIIIAVFLPETKGKTLQDIEDGFRSRSLEETGTADPLAAY